MRAVNPDDPAQQASAEQTPWKTIILVTVATTIAGQIVIDGYKAIKKRALKGSEEPAPPQQPQLQAANPGPPQAALGPGGPGPGYGGHAVQGPPLYAQAPAQPERHAPRQSPPTSWQQQPAGPPPQQNPQPQHSYGDLQAWEDRLRRWEQNLEDEQRQFRMMQGP